MATYMLRRFGFAMDGLNLKGITGAGTLSSQVKALRSESLKSISNISNKDSSVVIESLEVSAPVQVLQKLDETEITR